MGKNRRKGKGRKRYGRDKKGWKGTGRVGKIRKEKNRAGGWSNVSAPVQSSRSQKTGLLLHLGICKFLFFSSFQFKENELLFFFSLKQCRVFYAKPHYTNITK